MTFGTALYFAKDMRQDSTGAIEVLRSLADRGRVVRAQGMYAGSDRWSRLTKVSGGGLETIRRTIEEGEYSSLLVQVGDDDSPVAMLTVDLFSALGSVDAGRCPQTVEYSARCESSAEVDDAETFSLLLWRLFSPCYGFSMVDSSDRVVQEELSGVPISDWRSPRDPAREDWLKALQLARPDFGSHVRGAAWGTFLGPDLATRLGGEMKIRQAPAFGVRMLEGGSWYLRLTQEPLSLSSREYDDRAGQLERFLEPVVAPLLRGRKAGA